MENYNPGGLKVDYRATREFVRAEKLSYKKDVDCR
jgi:transposase